MLTIHDLLEDSRYKEFFCKVPKLPDHLTESRLPWRLYVQYKGDHRWRTKDFPTYQAAFKALKKLLPRAHDAAINCKAFPHQPPLREVRIKGKYFTGADGKKQQVTKLVKWKARIPDGEYEEHHWCPYCRRPTVFQHFTRHHALSNKKTAGIPIDPTLRRCSICGTSERLVSIR